jgi:hypothetical protein
MRSKIIHLTISLTGFLALMFVFTGINSLGINEAKAQDKVSESQPSSSGVIATIEDVDQLRADYEKLKKSKSSGDNLQYRLAIMGLIAVALRVGMQALKRLIPFTTRGKRALPIVACSIGLIAFVLAKIAGGETWPVSVMWGFVGPGSVVVHEVMNLFKPEVEATVSVEEV